MRAAGHGDGTTGHQPSRTAADRRLLILRLGVALVLSAGLHLAWWLLAPRKQASEPPPPPPESVQVELVAPPPPPSPPPPSLPALQPPAPRGPAGERSTARRPAMPGAPAPGKPLAPPPPASRAGGDAAPPVEGVEEEAAPSQPVDLFAAGALRQSVDTWSQGRAPPVKRAPGGTGTGSNSLADEARRVGGRVDGWLAQAQLDGAGQAGLTGGCDDGIDNNFDGEIDCSDAGCRQLPVCAYTGVYVDGRGEDLPDGDGRVVLRELMASQEGRVRKLTVRVRVSHGDPRQLNVSLTAPGGERVSLHAADDAESGYLTVFYVRALVGTQAAGRWTLEVEDTRAGVGGRLLGWELYVTS